MIYLIRWIKMQIKTLTIFLFLSYLLQSVRCAVSSLLAPSLIQRCKLLLWIQADAHQSLTTALRCRVTFFWILFTDQIDREDSLFASGRWYSKVYRVRSSARNTLSEEMKEIYQVSQIFFLIWGQVTKSQTHTESIKQDRERRWSCVSSSPGGKGESGGVVFSRII